jgi:two-component system response regulator RstA
MSLLPELRSTYPGPILAITGRVLDRSQAAILKAGADFFLAKPFQPRELAAVVESMLRMVHRIQNTSQATGGSAALYNSGGPCSRLHIEIGPICLDGLRNRATMDGRDLRLTDDEFALLWLLGSRAGQPVTREEISCYTRDRDHDPSSRAVDMLVSRLRHKLGDGQTPNRWILTVRNQGYQLTER